MADTPQILVVVIVSMTSQLVIAPSALEDAFVPESLSGREHHITEAMTSLKLFLAGGSFGRPGSGKTAIARHVLQRTAEETQARTAYVNCWESPTLYAVADSLVKQLRVLFAERSETIHKLERIKKVLGKSRLVP